MGSGKRSGSGWCVQCHGALPLGAGPRRRYCSNACVARAYRARRRFGERLAFAGQIASAFSEYGRSGDFQALAGSLPADLVLPRVREELLSRSEGGDAPRGCAPLFRAVPSARVEAASQS
jgi:hypothetical protein